jgi:hypothetical protein
METEEMMKEPSGRRFAITLYLVAFVTGAIVMSFEMLGSRYLAPSFGAGIYTWASLISTVLAALCIGYFLGGSGFFQLGRPRAFQLECNRARPA